jgi:pimeloyl-ACP methyl ester carboxylesterase
MIHGALIARRYLIPTAILLAKTMQVFVPDLPGHGESSRPNYIVTVEEQADILHEWLRLKGFKHVHIFANSYGCQIAVRLAAAYPETVRSLILTGPTVDPAAPTIFEQLWRLFLLSFYEPLGIKIGLIIDLLEIGLGRAIGTAKEMIRHKIEPDLARIKCPALILRGECDVMISEKWAQELASKINKGKYFPVLRASHCINYAAATELTSIILDFINENNKADNAK